MRSHHETEIKLPIRDPRLLKRRLTELAFRAVKARHFESNYLFDFPGQQLRKARCLLRLRFAGCDGALTFKGAPLRSRQYKIRREIEVPIPDGARLREVLECLGMKQVYCYEKYRTIYAPRRRRQGTGAAHLYLDETPIGNYLELEGPVRWIDKVARDLGYSPKDYITASYGALHRQKCLAEGTQPGNMVFTTDKS